MRVHSISASVVCIGDGYSFNYGCAFIQFFSVDADNPVYCSDENGVIYSKDKTTLIAYPAGNSRTDFRIPNGVTTIGDHAFGWSEGLTSVTIPESVTTIGNGAFTWCEGLTSVTIPEGVTTIGEGAFNCCTNLADVTLPDSVVCVSDGDTYPVFWSTALYENEENWTDGVLYIGNHLIAAKDTLAGMYSVREGTRSIEAGAFRNCEEMTGITIPNGITVIGPSTFSGCSNLKTITIPDSVTSIGGGAFWGCTNLASVTIPDSVTSIGRNAFGYCESLVSLTIPNSVTSIGELAFYGCTSLASVTIPNSVTSIDGEVFYRCTSLSWVHIPASVTQIEDNVFDYCTNLSYICSDTANCYAKIYAEANGIEFRVCDGTHSQSAPQTQTLPLHPQSDPNVTAESGDAAFDVPVSLLAEPQERASDNWQKYEFDLSLRVGDEKMQAVYLIRPVDENGAVVQPNAGHKVTLRIPIPAGCSVEKCRIAHLLDDQGTSESFKLNPTGKAKPFTVSADGKYFIIEVTSFSPFIVFEEQLPVTLKLRDTKKTLPFGEKRTLTLDVENLPDGAKIVWAADNDHVELKPSADGKTCEVAAKKNGKVTVTATVYDVYGNPIKQDGGTVSASVNLQTKAGFLHKLFYWFFRTPWPFS